MSPVALSCSGVTVAYEERVVLRGVELSIEAGSLGVLTGATGSGKTSLLHVLAGLVAPGSGEVLIKGVPLSQVDTADRPALVAQDPEFLRVLDAAETVALPLQVCGRDRATIASAVERALEAVGLASCARRPVDDLSGGQRQRLALARALALGAGVIVLDEPTAGLDAANRARMAQLLDAERVRGAALLVVTHDAGLLERADTRYDLGRWSAPGR